ncbi:MAG: ABC transporter ATP-binding protein [Lachnospiraceae bacterium]|jgi:peptide/nickel transport system ATP-binding protein|nr:ABC transporter ATP-binding protein [Lachnospiraceae bacterium]MCI9251739.1 ABC transporter ATP-binding protein [Lachnospiraceae bacterium]MCI9384113.1 ABC transporter ATP-binding protein [Lachnospiraceae bacterium]MCI9624093.1 ABC transporter ATP-binding protein [Lachnospiraceae bacterium]
MNEKKVILEIQNLSISFQQYDKGFGRTDLDVIRDLNVTVHEGEMVAVVGSSGSGKSLLAHGILGILPYNGAIGGTILYDSEELTQKRKEELRGNEIVLVPQSVAFLDPLMKIGPQIRKGKKDPESKEKLNRIFEGYHLKQEVQELYPFEMSGGMNRRVLVSTAMMGNPRLVIADEPTPGLHMKMVRRVMSHFRELADQGAGVLLITHDLEQALEVADRVVVFYAGTTVEDADVKDFAREETLRHPYSKALWRALPQNGFQFISGTQPYVKELPQGCPFGPRCGLFCEKCKGEIPYREVRGGKVRCLRGE